MNIIGSIVMWAGATLIAPEGYSFGGETLPCTEYQKLCEVLSPYYVKDGFVTLPHCLPLLPGGVMIASEATRFMRENPDKTCIIRIK